MMRRIISDIDMYNDQYCYVFAKNKIVQQICLKV